MPLPVCKICGKKMPPSVLERHIEKSHSTKREKVGEVTPEAPKAKKFDYDTAYWCHQCQADIPDILKDFHMHVKHGL